MSLPLHLFLMLSLAGCATTASVPADPFDQFRQTFRAEALAAGVRAETYDREMATAAPLPIVLERNDSQPELTRPIWSYIEGAASAQRIALGRQNIAAHEALLADIEAKFDVDRHVIGAVWGLESSFGALQGTHDVISALATLAYDGRRQPFGRAQLLAALTIIDKGFATRAELKGSWAGAMGQTQFIPTTYLDYAIDQNGDGRRDLWSSPDDVFASTANYLSKSGYKRGQPWAFEVRLPDDFEYADASLATTKTVAEWSGLGLKPATGTLAMKADLSLSASVIVPAGAAGPAFMVFENYRAILKYNNSTSYALGVGMLMEGIAGTATPLMRDWPRTDRPLTLDERKSLQTRLAALGFDPGPVDGIVGAGTQKALRAWQKANGLPADGYASAAILQRLGG